MSEALWGVIIGGLIAVLPPMLTSIIQGVVQNKKEKLSIKRDTYDKIIRYLYYTQNWNLKTNKAAEINKFTEETSVLATLYCSFKLQKMVGEYGDLFHEYVNAVKQQKTEDVENIKENLKSTCQRIRKQISLDMGNK